MATPQSSPELTLQVRRTFAASREKVFAAWTEREQLLRDGSAPVIGTQRISESTATAAPLDSRE